MNENDTKNELLSEGEADGSLASKRNKIADFIAKIGCLLLAFFLWYYAAASDSSVFVETFSSIPVKIVNESGFSVLSGDDVVIDITVSGKRNLINRLSVEDITAYVDISAVTEAGKDTYPIQYELPNGVTLEKSNVDSISVYVDNTTSVSVPIKVSVTNYMLEDGYELGLSAITTDIRHLSVTGPEAVVNQIDHALLAADIGHVTRSVRYSGDLKLIDTDGNEVTNSYVTANITTATATIPVYKYRDVPITLLYKHGYFHNNNCSVTIHPSSVRIRGEVDVVDAVRLEYEIDEKAISNKVSYSFGVSLPATVQNVNNIQDITVSLELKGMATRVVSVYNISVTNPAGLAYEAITGPIDVTLCGESSLVSRISQISISAIVDLSAQSGGTGTVMAPVTIRVAESYQDKVYELGTYTIPVKILG